MIDREEESRRTVTITVYSPEYKDQVRDVIGKTLVSVDVISPESLPIDDPDLNDIEKEYLAFWIALAEGRVVGTVGIRDVGNQVAKLNRMFALPEHHGSGIGQQLLDTATDFAEEHGFNKLVLHSDLKMHRAHRFYEKNGFVKTGQEVDRYLYEKKLLSLNKAPNTFKH